MPIHQLNLRSGQNWRQNQKKSRPEKKKISGPRRSWLVFLSWKNALLAAGGLVVLIALALAGTVAWMSRGLPDPNHLISREVPENTKIFDRTGETVLYEIHGNQSRTLMTLDQIPAIVKNAAIAIEDKNFYHHKGFSLWAILRTAITNVLLGKKAGGSTLTQQLVKNAILTTEKTYTRKIKELVLAYKIEKRFSKDEILQMYLNEVPYGSTAYGVEAASQRYFGKSVKEISLAEAAVLAAITQAPTRYSPYGSNHDILISRQHYVLDLMAEQGFISAEEKEAAKAQELKFKPPAENITAPHFVMYVKELITERFGEKAVEQGGLKIYTTLDLYKQKIAEAVIEEKSANNQEKYNATNAALVSLDPKNGQILALVGSRDFFNEEIDGQVNIATRSRQPGSSLKPLVYAALFLKGYPDKTILYDVNTNFSNDPNKPYEPKNYDSQEHGPVTARQALAGSLNTPAVKAIYLAGVGAVLQLAENFGYSTLKDPDRFGLSLVLGGGEVKLLEHTAAFGAFAREGVFFETAAILRVTDKNGQTLWEHQEEKRQVLDPKIARLVSDILSDNQARSFIFGEKNWLTLGQRPVAAKTGTTNDYRDAWTIGYTPSLVAGVWVGNNNNTEMKRGADGSKVAAPIWNEFMKQVLGDTPVENFKKPETAATGKPVLDGVIGGEKIVKIDRASGRLATDETPSSFIEEKTFSEDHCLLYYINKDDPLGDPPTDPNVDPQFTLWESRVLEWAAKLGRSSSSPPLEFDDLHVPANRPAFEIASPQNGGLLTTAFLDARLGSLTAARGVKRAEYFINGNLLATITDYPFNLQKNIAFLPNGYHTLLVRACDDIDNCAEKTVEINLKLDGDGQPKTFSLSWLEPTEGLAAADIDFPLKLKLKLENSAAIARVNFFYLDKDDQTVFISFVQPAGQAELTSLWADPPITGTYRLYAEAVGWSTQSFKTKEVVVNINSASRKSLE
ncbi:penicillin-binding protein [Candidatus Falkowbacteria bacterium CG_4_10_14_0_2_um_filter_48_10]|uniref:Penicillin-binding protein n=1 Tax=Candidatus Falkowbacteria bacterium CG23_combo_of_CG06-09_8_20_14_all_49_15 TaxID=1974572 RepID=A0A2G9ZLM6_9BACT|nr:MAG: penicillin-binding protein [Candidatus Falkowbacteria bacterium CG23_combo_of_CG06-09_8_20_14_all_49_15]PJA07840.1 MAG: penicillin-binding protein [Candidatus Falkowbacteria bacterium CG_4_10_14_0_2_um_filter_48_10]